MKPFPWHAVDTAVRGENQAIAALRAWLGGRRGGEPRSEAFATPLERIQRAWERETGVPIAMVPPRRTLPKAEAMVVSAGVLVAEADAPSLGSALLLEAEPALANELITRALRQPSPPWLTHGGAPTPRIAGAFAAVIVSLSRARRGAPALRVFRAGSGAALFSELASTSPDLVSVPVTVLVNDTAFDARVTFARAHAVRLHGELASSLDAGALERLGALPLRVPLVVAQSVAAPGDMLALVPGDIWFPGESLALRRNGADVTGSFWAGTAALVAPMAERGVSVGFLESGQLVYRGDSVSHPWVHHDEDTSVMNDDQTEALSHTLAEVPVVVRVELGSAEMRAREWASLGVGDVITLGRRIGERATLRVAGIEVARGELVDVEGELGVRIVERIQP